MFLVFISLDWSICFRSLHFFYCQKFPNSHNKK